jgi:hypothetical protein
VWPWIAAGIGLVALVGAVAAYFAFWRRPAWDTPSEPWAASSTTQDDEIHVPTSTGVSGSDDAADGTGLTAAESSLTSSGYNPQEV